MYYHNFTTMLNSSNFDRDALNWCNSCIRSRYMNAISLARAITTSFAILTAAIFGISCATYTIPKNSFDNQIKISPLENLKFVKIRIPALGIRTYPSNGIEYIMCEDDKHQQIELKISPSVEVKFSTLNGSSSIMFFDSIYRNDSLVIGLNSRLIPNSWDTIPISTIQNIKIQDGRKNYSYVM